MGWKATPSSLPQDTRGTHARTHARDPGRLRLRRPVPHARTMDSDDEVDNPIGEDVSAPTRARAPPFRFLPPCFCDGSPSAQRGAATAVFLLLGLVVSPLPLSSTERLAHARVSPSSPALAPLSCLSAQDLTDFERKRAILIAQNEAMRLSLGISALSAKVGGNDNGSGGGSALSTNAWAPGTCASIKRGDRALVEKPRPSHMVLRERVAEVDCGEEEVTEIEEPPHKVPRLTEPSSYSAIGTSRATFQVPCHPQPTIFIPTRAATRHTRTSPRVPRPAFE